MSTQTSKARLAGLLKSLLVDWDQTRSTWTDDKSREFHQRYMLELIFEVEKAIAALENLEKLMQRVKEDCE